MKNIADEYMIAIVLIHHFRKQRDSDVFNQITGSTGLQGACDTMFVLAQGKRGDKSATLYCIGRDIESRELELERSEENVWIKLSDSNTEKNLKDLSFIKTIEKFMKDKENFVGTATELSSQLVGIGDDNFSNKVISKNIKKLSRSLENLGILGVSRRTGNARIIELIKVNDDNDVKNPVP